MNLSVLELVLLLVVEHKAKLLNVGHNGSAPSGTLHEREYGIKEPVLTQVIGLRVNLRFLLLLLSSTLNRPFNNLNNYWNL